MAKERVLRDRKGLILYSARTEATDSCYWWSDGNDLTPKRWIVLQIRERVCYGRSTNENTKADNLRCTLAKEILGVFFNKHLLCFKIIPSILKLHFIVK